MVERWLGFFGEERTLALLHSNNRVPLLSGYLLDPKRSGDAEKSLERTGCRVLPGRLLRDAWVLEGGNPAASEAVRCGWVAIQDEASQAVACLMAADPGDSVLDLCAAPGGKSIRLARAVGAKGKVIAADLHEHRVRAMQARLDLAGIGNVETIALDAEQPLPFDRTFERILVDVPCSGTGTLARHPEIRWKLRAEDLRVLHDRQAQLLRNALPLLAQHGRLVYSTCSLEPEENELVVREVLGESGDTFHIVNARPTIENFLREPVRGESVVSSEGFFRTFPPAHGTDGFFAASIERRASKD
jgi:16S rRNA (cytosine967-C5)-methyltransferase